MNLPHPDAADGLALTHDTILGGRLRLMQPAQGHRAGTDAVLLAAATPASSGLLIDVGAGVGTVGLAIAQRDSATRVLLLERAPALAALARRNVLANGLADRVSVAEADLLSAPSRKVAGVTNGAADCVVTNPPFYAAAHGTTSSDALRRAAHVLDGSIGDWIDACTALLRGHGQIVMIHKADALPIVLGALRTSYGGLKVRFVHPGPSASATRLLVAGTKGSRGPVTVLSPLVLHHSDGGFSAIGDALHEGTVEKLT